MNKLYIVLMLVPVLCISMLSSASAKPAKSGNFVAAGWRYHARQEELSEVPFGEGDVAYGLAYEYHEAEAAWQLAVGYCSDVTGYEGSDPVDYIITPEINLIAKDEFWRGGIGMLYSYLDHEEEKEWVGPYWQLLLGLDMPLFGLNLQGRTYYDFEEFDDLGDFDLNKLDYGVWVSFSF